MQSWVKAALHLQSRGNGCNHCITCTSGSLFLAIKDPIVLSWELKAIAMPHGRSEGLNGSAGSCGSPFCWILRGQQEVAPTGQEKNKTMSFALVLAITDLSQVTLNLAHSRFCTSARRSICLNLGNVVLHADKKKPR